MLHSTTPPRGLSVPNLPAALELEQDVARLMDAVESAKAQLGSLKNLTHAHSTKREAALAKIETQCALVKRQTVLFLDARLLDKKGLSVHQRSMTARVLCEMANELVDTPHGDGLRDMLNRHEPPKSNARSEQDAYANYAKYDFDALFEKIDQQQHAAAARRSAAQAARQATKKAAMGKRTPQEQADEGAAKVLLATREQAIKAIYRKLSSALHPDKERDPLIREQKNSLMVEANKAYAAQDVDDLLRLQKEAKRYGHVGTGLGEAQLALLSDMLQQQLLEVQAESEGLRQRIRVAFGLPYNAAVTQLALDKRLKNEVETMLGEAAYVSGQFARMQVDNGFLKLWLREMDQTNSF